MASAAFGYVKLFVTPKYSSTVKMYVNNDSNIVDDYLSSGEVLVARELVDTYIAILQTPDTLGEVVERSGLNYTTGQLSSMISAGSVNETEMFYVTVQCADPIEAAQIATVISEVLPGRISEIVEKSSVKVVQKAKISYVPTSPNVSRYVMVGGLLGALISCALLILKELLNKSIQDENYPSEVYEVRTLAYIPDLYEMDKRKTQVENAKNKKNKLLRDLKIPSPEESDILCEHLPFAAAESYKMLRANLLNLSENENAYKVIGITSPNPSVGKSTLAINFAYTLAQTGKSVVLIEADMRKPVLAKRINLKGRLGLSDMLLDSEMNAVQDSGVMENWKVISAGTSVTNPSELLGGREMDLLVEKMRQTYDYVLIDLPPVNEVSDAMTVSRCLDGMLCAVKQGSTTKVNLETAMHNLTYSKAELLGFVITNVNVGSKYGKYGRYGSYGKYYT